MKAVATFLLSLLGFTGVLVSPAQADDYYHWPDYGSFASHNDSKSQSGIVVFLGGTMVFGASRISTPFP